MTGGYKKLIAFSLANELLIQDGLLTFRSKRKKRTGYLCTGRTMLLSFVDESDCFHFWGCFRAASHLLIKWLLWNWLSRATLIQRNNEVKTRTIHRKKVDNSSTESFFLAALLIIAFEVYFSRGFVVCFEEHIISKNMVKRWALSVWKQVHFDLFSPLSCQYGD